MNVIIVLLYIEQECKPYFCSSVMASNTKHVNLTWLPLVIMHGMIICDLESLTWLLYNLQLDKVTGANSENSLYAFGQSEKR